MVCSACLRCGLLASTSRPVRAMPKVLRTRVTVIPLGWIRSLVCPPGEVIVTCALTLRLSPVPTTMMSGRPSRGPRKGNWPMVIPGSRL